MSTGILSCVEVCKRGVWEYLPDPLFPNWEFKYFPNKQAMTCEPLQSQNYSLFGFLSGVRGEMDPLKEPVGLPKDISDPAKKYLSQSHFFCHSFYTLKELTKVNYTRRVSHLGKETLNDVLGDEYFNMIKTLKKYCASTVRDCSKIRVLFCFD